MSVDGGHSGRQWCAAVMPAVDPLRTSRVQCNRLIRLQNGGCTR
jgi:hypothetical protein